MDRIFFIMSYNRTYLWQNYSSGLTKTNLQIYKYKNKRILCYQFRHLSYKKHLFWGRGYLSGSTTKKSFFMCVFPNWFTVFGKWTKLKQAKMTIRFTDQCSWAKMLVELFKKYKFKIVKKWDQNVRYVRADGYRKKIAYFFIHKLYFIST